MHFQEIKFSILAVFVFALAILGCKENKTADNESDSSMENTNVNLANGTFTNPLLESGPDPWTIYHKGNYYYIKSGNRAITLMRTPDITDLKNAEKKVIWKAPESGDHSQEIWAPEIHNIDGNWYVYVAADE